MPARTRKIRHDDETRAKIQAGNIINRLTKCVMGDVELSPAQVQAARILLAKILPDLTSVEHSGEIATSYVAEMPQSSPTAEAWATQHAPKPLLQ